MLHTSFHIPFESKPFVLEDGFFGEDLDTSTEKLGFMFIDIHNRSETQQHRVSSSLFSQEKMKIAVANLSKQGKKEEASTGQVLNSAPLFMCTDSSTTKTRFLCYRSNKTSASLRKFIGCLEEVYVECVSNKTVSPPPNDHSEKNSNPSPDANDGPSGDGAPSGDANDNDATPSGDIAAAAAPALSGDAAADDGGNGNNGGNCGDGGNAGNAGNAGDPSGDGVDASVGDGVDAGAAVDAGASNTDDGVDAKVANLLNVFGTKQKIIFEGDIKDDVMLYMQSVAAFYNYLKSIECDTSRQRIFNKLISLLKKNDMLSNKAFKQYMNNDFFSNCSNNFIRLSIICQQATKFVVRVPYAGAMLHHLVNFCSFREKFNNEGYLFLHPELNEMNEDDKVIFDDTTSYVLVANSLTPSNISSLLDGMFKGMIPIANFNDNKDM